VRWIETLTNIRRIIWPDFNTGTGLEAGSEEARMPPFATPQT
jgi:hypothetical protein